MLRKRIASLFHWRAAPNQKTCRLQVQALEERAVPTLNTPDIFAIGSGGGMDATVKVYTNTGALMATFKPYPLPGNTFFQGGVKVAVGDINNDGVFDVVTAAGQGGGPHVKVFNGVDIMNGSSNPSVLRDFFAYQPDFLGGVNVAVGDVNGDGLQDIVTGAGPGGGPHVVAYSNGFQNQQLMNFFPYDINFRGGVNVACGDIGGDQDTDEVITGAGSVGAADLNVGPLVNVYNFVDNGAATQNQQRLASFFAYAANLRCGVFVASGATSNNRDAQNFLYADIITGPGQGGGPHVKVFRLLDAVDNPPGTPNWVYFQAGEVFAYTPTFTGGVRVGVVRTGQFDNILTAAGVNGGPHQKTFNQTSIGDLETYIPTLNSQLFAFDATYLGGIFIG
jgi:hypothetical protein